MSRGGNRVNLENKAMRNILALMGFDTERLIRFATDNQQAPWMRATFAGLTVQIDPEKAQQSGASPNSIESMKAILNGLRTQEGNHV
jgi:hypothetical protein